MIPQINILSVVDVIGALSSGTLTNNLFMVDNRREKRIAVDIGRPNSSIQTLGRDDGQSRFGVGTSALTTNTTFTQVLNWHVLGVDFQTDVQINKVRFYQNGVPITAADTPCARLGRYGAPSGEYWAGVINLPSLVAAGEYQYLIEFNIGGKLMTMEKFATLNVGA